MVYNSNENAPSPPLPHNTGFSFKSKSKPLKNTTQLIIAVRNSSMQISNGGECVCVWGGKLSRIPLIIYMCVKHVRQDVGWDAHMLRPENQIKAAIYHLLVFNGCAKRKDLLHMFGVTEGSGGGKDE